MYHKLHPNSTTPQLHDEGECIGFAGTGKSGGGGAREMKKIGLQGGPPKKPVVSGVIAVIAPGKRVITPRNGSQGNAVEIEAIFFSLFLVLFFTDSTKGKSPFTQHLGAFSQASNKQIQDQSEVWLTA